jgi:hypothetical protein
MRQRHEYEMTQQQLDKLLEAAKPVPMIALQCGRPPSQQENANRAWRVLAEELGFVWDSVKPSPKGQRFFTAEESDDSRALRGIVPDAVVTSMASIPADHLGVRPLHIIFDGPPSHESGRFVECETPDGRGVSAGEWVERADGLWALVVQAVYEVAP